MLNIWGLYLPTIVPNMESMFAFAIAGSDDVDTASGDGCGGGCEEVIVFNGTDNCDDCESGPDTADEDEAELFRLPNIDDEFWFEP